MKRALDVIGLPVLALANGEEIGTVRDFLCDLQLRVIGFILQEDKWFQKGMYIPADKLETVGADFIMVKDEHVVTSMRQIDNESIMTLINGEYSVKGKQVVTENGIWLGKVEDVYFSKDWDKLVGYEVSDGFLTDLTKGRKRITAIPPVQFGKEHLIVTDTR
ncbi:PRC-barrel domain-containing protein [Brevibacillus daliensis]|uniref:PRC-barrel domain-containing protein n=1 Tax=Brevibacillus daliensis TaxID=2892995 RepID=UPI001E608DF7|nr:PRC-barrel domain-containing protein [Brevibacillus daliensis]